jgi:hypothetical protein
VAVSKLTRVVSELDKQPERSHASPLRFLQGWPIRSRARHLLGENLLAPCFGERVPLQGQILVNRRHPRVAEQHAFR